MKKLLVLVLSSCVLVPCTSLAQQRWTFSLSASAATIVGCPMSQATATMGTWTVAVEGDAYAGTNPQGNDRYDDVVVQYYDVNQHPNYAVVPIPEGGTGTISLTGRNLCLFFTDSDDIDNHGSITATITSSSTTQTTWTVYAADAAIVPLSTVPPSPTGMFAFSAQGKAYSGAYARNLYQAVVLRYNDPVTIHIKYAVVPINGGSIGISGIGPVLFMTDTNDSDNRGSVSGLATVLTIAN